MRVSKPPHQRRAELIAAARRLFDQYGVEKTRVSDIVAEVGVAQGVFYYYFASKEEMVKVVVRQVADEVTARSQAILADKSAGFTGKLAAMIDLMLDLVDQFLGDDATQLPLPPGAVHGAPGFTGYRLVREGLHRLVAQGVEDGELSLEYPAETIDMLLYGIEGLASERLPTRAMVYALVEQGMGLARGSLARCGREPKKHA